MLEDRPNSDGSSPAESFLLTVLCMTHSGESGDQIFDIGIGGGDPAGLCAAIWSARYGRSVALVDRGDPRNWETRGVNGYLGLPGVRPAELRGSGREALRGYGVTLIDAAVLLVEREEPETVGDADTDGLLVLRIEGGRTMRARVASSSRLACGTCGRTIQGWHMSTAPMHTSALIAMDTSPATSASW